MTHLFPNYSRREVEFVSGEGCTRVDAQGQQYLDLTSGIGVVGLGYNHPELNQALQEQSTAIWHTPNLYQNSLQETLAQQLGGSFEYLSYFCNSGAEANEAAIKLARKATGRTKVISFTHSFHGRTYGAMSATGQAAIHEGFQPLVPGFSYVAYNDLEGLKAELDQGTAGVMLELVQGEGGVLPAQKEWAKGVAELCKKNGTLLIVDEVQTGIGRTGTFYAFEGYGLDPDIVTLAKGLGNGFPVGAMLGKKEIASAFGPGSHGSTFGGNKLGLSVATKVVAAINQPHFLGAVVHKGNQAMKYLTSALQGNPLVKDIRGKGLMIGIELADGDAAGKALDRLQAQGVLVLRAGTSVLRLLPPLTITEAELAEGIQKISHVLEEMKND